MESERAAPTPSETHVSLGPTPSETGMESQFCTMPSASVVVTTLTKTNNDANERIGRADDLIKNKHK